MSKLLIPQEVLAQHIAILGKTRSGKSSVMRLLVENLLERKLPVCIVDPKGDWWGIKLAADGKGPGYPVVIFGGEHADIPIDESHGAKVAELFATGNRPCLIDLGGWMVAPRTRFWIDFASTLFKHTKGDRWLAVDEFHNFAPKGSLKGREGDMAKALHWSNRLASEGLGKGLAMLFASQRPQKVHNDALTSAETLIAMRVLHPSDRGAVSDWIKGCGDSEGSEVLNSLAQMERGEGWVWSPEIGFGPKRVKFQLFRTYDSFRAQTVEDTKGLRGWADVNIDDIKAKFAAAIEKAKQEDPKELRRQLAEQSRRIRELERAAPSSYAAKTVETIKRVEVQVVKEPQIKRVESVAKLLAGVGDKLAQVGGQLVTVSKELLAALAKASGNGHHAPPRPATNLQRPAATLPRPVPVSASTGRGSDRNRAPTGDEELGGGVARRMMVALAQFGQLSHRRLAMLAGVKRGGSTWRGGMAKLRGAGYLSEEGALVQLSPAGQAAVGPYEPLPTGPALIEYWRSNLGGGAPLRAFDAILAAYPNALDADELAEAMGAERGGSTMRGALAMLRKFELIPQRELVASEELFQ